MIIKYALNDIDLNYKLLSTLLTLTILNVYSRPLSLRQQALTMATS